MPDSAPQPETREQRAERLAPIAAAWSTRLRGEDVDVLAAELLDPLPRLDLYALIGLLGGAADTSLHPDIWWTWVRHRDVIADPSPIVWPDDQVPIEELDSERIDRLLLHWDGQRKHADIARDTGLTENGVAQRLRRLRSRAGVG